MNAVIIFDVSQKEKEVKDALLKMGYFDKWLDASKQIVNLPLRTVWKPNIELALALNDIRGIVQQLSNQSPMSPVVLQRCLILPNNPWNGILGSPIG